jgi:TonB family protein
MGMEGSLLVRIQISEEGIVREISTLQSSGYPILDRSAYDGIYRWRFPRTGLESGIELRVNFRLTEGN